MNCPVFIVKCPENPDKATRTDTRARIGIRTLSGVRIPSGFALSVSGFVSAEKLCSGAGAVRTPSSAAMQQGA